MSVCPLCHQPTATVVSHARFALTPQQRQLRDFIRDYIGTHDGVAPSFEEMRVCLQLRSKSSVHRLINGLEERGWLKRLPNHARALQIIDDDGAVLPTTRKRA